MLRISKRTYPLELDGRINRLISENEALKQYKEETENALIELAELLAEQDDAIVELAEFVEGN